MGIRVVQGSGCGNAASTNMSATCGAQPNPLISVPSRDSRLMRLSPKSFKGTLSPNKRTNNQRPPVLPEESSTGGEDSIQDTCPGDTGVQSETAPQTQPAPRAVVDKPFLLSDGRVALEASLDKASYSHGEPVKVNVIVNNSSHKTVRRIKVFVVQHVDVCMFSNGKFKNVVALTTSRDECPISPGGLLNNSYILRPARGTTKNWIALEDSYSKNGASLASTVVCNSSSPEDRNVFAIYVSYYVKVKLSLSAMGGELSLKLPFILAHSCREDELQSPNANTECPTDDIISDPNEQILKDNYRKKPPLIKYESKDLSSPKDDIDDMQLENIIIDPEHSGRIVVSVEGHQPIVGKKIDQSENKRLESAVKKTPNEDDMNLITNYDSDST